MKRNIFVALSVVWLVCILISCSRVGEPNASSPTPTADTTPTVLTAEQATPATTEQTPMAGSIIGDVFYKGITVSTIFQNHPESILGTRMDISYGPYYFFDDLSVQFDGESVFQIQFLNLNMFELNGIFLDLTKSELMAAFGDPIEYYEYNEYIYRDTDEELEMRYHVMGSDFTYVLEFWFYRNDDPHYVDDKARICRVFRTSWPN